MTEIKEKVSLALRFDASHVYMEAYRSYLDGMSLIISSLGKQYVPDSSLSRETLKLARLGKQCMDRIVELCSILMARQGTQYQSSNVMSPLSPTSPQPSLSPREHHQVTTEAPKPYDGNVQGASSERIVDPGPLEMAHRQNRALLAAYRKRMSQMSPNIATNLSLSLQRQLATNLSVAQAKEEALAKKMKERHRRLTEEAARYNVPGHALTGVNYVLKSSLFAEKIPRGRTRDVQSFNPNDTNNYRTSVQSTLGMSKNELERRQLYMNVLQFEQNSTQLQSWRERLKSKRENARIVHTLIRYILSLNRHPITQSLYKYQYATYDKIQPLLKRFDSNSESPGPTYETSTKHPSDGTTSMYPSANPPVETSREDGEETSVYVVANLNVGEQHESIESKDGTTSMYPSANPPVNNKNDAVSNTDSCSSANKVDVKQTNEETDIGLCEDSAAWNNTHVDSEGKRNSHVKIDSNKRLEPTFNKQTSFDSGVESILICNTPLIEEREPESTTNASSKQNNDIEGDKTSNLEEGNVKADVEVATDSTVLMEESFESITAQDVPDEKCIVFKDMEHDALERHLSHLIQDVSSYLERLQAGLIVAYPELNTASGKDACYAALEEPFFTPLWPYIVALERAVHKSSEDILHHVMSEHAHCTPADLFVPEKFTLSEPIPSKYSFPYEPAVIDLRKVVQCTSPLTKLEAIVVASRAVIRCVEEHYTVLCRSALPNIGADDLLPLLSYCFVRSGLPTLFSECQALESFIHEGYLMGEEGYCLLSLQTAIKFVIKMHQRN